jgi:TolB-like protein
MSGDPEQEYFADGMVEEIITALSRFRSLFVVARNSSFTYKGRAVDIKQVGRELGVRYVLEGSVRKAGGRVRITGQLIEAETGAHLWADHFDGTLEDVFDLQDQVTGRVVGAIAPRLEHAEYERSKRKPTESLGAYDYYLRGIALSAHPTKEENDEALRLFTKAIERDPEFAAPYARAAIRYAARRGWGWDIDPDREASEAIRLARTAIRLGADDASVLGFGGFVIAYLDDLESGADYVDRARALNPNIHWGAAGWISMCLGRPEIAITQLTNAMRYSPIDPALVYWRFWIAQAHFFACHDDEAVAWMKMALQILPDNPTLLRVFAVCLASAGRIEEATEKVSQANRIDPKLRAFFNSFQGTPLRRAEDRKRIAEGLRLAGLPE